MNITKLIGAIALFSILCTGLNAQSDTALTLSIDQAQNFAIENYYMSKNAKSDIESAEKKIWETTAIGLPQISGGVDYIYTPEVPEASFGGQTFLYGTMGDDDLVTGADLNDPERAGIGYAPSDPIKLGVENDISYNLMLTQLLFSGEYIVGLQASKAFKLFSEEAYEKTTIEIKEIVAGSYFSIVILEKNAELLQGTVDNLTKIYSDTKKSSELGLIDVTEADQIAINVTRTSNQLKSVERQIEFMYKMLKYQLGLSIEADLTLSQDIDQLIEANIIQVDNLYNFNLEENIDYRMLSTQEKLNQLSLNREKSLYLPSLSAFYQYNDKFEKAALDFTVKHMVGVSLAVPIFNSGLKNAKVSQARIELEKSQLEKEQESQALIMVSEQARFDYLTAFETYENEITNFELSTRILENTTAKYNQGMVSSMDLTLANNQYLEAQLSISSAILDLLTAKVALDKAHNQL